MASVCVCVCLCIKFVSLYICVCMCLSIRACVRVSGGRLLALLTQLPPETARADLIVFINQVTNRNTLAQYT